MSVSLHLRTVTDTVINNLKKYRLEDIKRAVALLEGT